MPSAAPQTVLFPKSDLCTSDTDLGVIEIPDNYNTCNTTTGTKDQERQKKVQNNKCDIGDA